ncbi:50S ribosomal protein L10 [Candidatus Bipolaricaulota bacterium]|nr:50S ribosomal protein L10 [Candidatus Bipolaricaulota bacterium]
MPKPEKVAAVEELKQRLSRARTVVLVDYRGLPAPDITELRRFVRKQGVEFRVVKNTLAKRAAEEAGFGYLADFLRGPNALVLGEGDPAIPFRVARECARRFPQFQVKAGVFDGQPVAPAEVDWYANLPSREELLARLAGALAGPMRGLAVALSGVVRKLAVVLAEVQKQKAEG